MAEKEEVVYEEVVLEEFKSEETEIKDNQTTVSRNIPGGGTVAERANGPCGSLSRGKLFLIFVGVALLLAVSSAAITAIVLTMNFDSRLREMARGIVLKHGGMDQDQLQASFEKLLAKSHRYKDITSNVQQNEDAITILQEESEQQHTTLVRLNTTLLKHGAKVSLLNDNFKNMKASVEKLIDNSHLYKDLTNNVQQNEDAITSLLEESEQQHTTLVRLNTTLLKHGAKVSLLNDSLDDIKPSIEKLMYNSRRYKVCLHGGKNAEDGLCECQHPYYGAQCEKVYIVDCYDLINTGKPTGIYAIHPRGSNQSFHANCDMDTDGGGWTVFQYRYEGSVEFYRNFTDYKNGFGSLEGEFWLGLEYIHVMTSSAPSVLRIDVAAADGTIAYQMYEDFNISEGLNYSLNIGATSGTAGDGTGSYIGFSYNNGRPFTTYDRDSDYYTSGNCADLYHGAWWYSGCGAVVNLNGEYLTPGTTRVKNGVNVGMFHRDFKNKYESLKTSKMMFRRK